MLGAGTMTRHPFFDAAEARTMARTGEREYYRQRGQEARQWITSHPARFLSLTASRTLLFFLPAAGVAYHPWFYYPLFLLFVGAVIQFGRQEPRTTLALGAALGAFALPHVFVQSSVRYSYPVLWLMVLFASWMTLRIWNMSGVRLRRERLSDSASTRT
jgi:hypothetical protein